LKDDFHGMDGTYVMNNGEVGISKPGEFAVDRTVMEKVVSKAAGGDSDEFSSDNRTKPVETSFAPAANPAEMSMSGHGVSSMPSHNFN